MESELEKQSKQIIGEDFIRFVKDNLDKKWSWYSLSLNNIITWDIIQNNSDIPWDWNAISYNTNITSEIIYFPCYI